MSQESQSTVTAAAEPTSEAGPSGSLSGTRVIDLSRVLAGPLCTQILADHGAEVIKIEPPQGDETRRLGPPFIGDTAAYFHGLNRNKFGLALDLSKKGAREVLLRLLEGADVLIENFLPGTMEKWGLGFQEVLAPRFPRLVYCRVSGFGSDGPLGGLPGYDAVVQAVCGLMSVNGHESSGATRIGVPAVDIGTGLTAAIGILLALAERTRSGKGQFVEACLFDTALSILHPHSATWLASGTEPVLTGNAHPSIAPYDKFAASDGEVFIGVLNDNQFRKLCSFMGRDDLFADPRFAIPGKRLENRESLRREIEAALAKLDATQLCDELMRVGVPAARVNTVSQAFSHPHTKSREMIVGVEDYQGVGIPIKLARTPGSVRLPPPGFGAHTWTVLEKAGFSKTDIDAMVSTGVAHVQPMPQGSSSKAGDAMPPPELKLRDDTPSREHD